MIGGHSGRRPARRVVATIVAVGLGLGLAGLSACTGGDADRPPSTNPSAGESTGVPETTTPSVTATKPALKLGEPTEDSAVEFVKYFWETTNYAYATYDTSLLRAISQAGCKYCTFVINEVQDLKVAGITIGGSEAFVVQAALPPDEPIVDSAFVLTVSSQRPGTTTTPDGKVTKVEGSKNSQIAFGLDWDGGRWLVRGVEIQKKGSPWSG